MLSQDHFNELQDRFGDGYRWANDFKVNNLKLEPARVMSYDPKTNNAKVVVLRSGPGEITVKGAVHYQGATPGTGEAHAYYKGQYVVVQFLMGQSTGIVNQGIIVGTLFTKNDSHAPAYAPWARNGTGSVVVHENPNGGWGYAQHIDQSSNISRTTVAKTNVEDWGNEHVLQNGPTTTRAEELSRRAADGANRAASMLS